MKKILLTYVLMISGFVSYSQLKSENILQDKMEIHGTIQQSVDWVYLKQFNGEKRDIVDSAKVKNGHFNFELDLNEPQMIYLSITGQDDFPIFAQNSKISVQLAEDAKLSSTVTGSKAHQEWMVIDEKLNEFDQKLDSIYSAYKVLAAKNDTSGLSRVADSYDAEEKKKVDYVSNYIKQNPGSYHSAYLVTKFYSYSSDLNELESYVDLFAENKLKSMYIQSIVKRIEELNKTKLGVTIPDFEQADSNDHNININDFRGQYVLIDFWASWCGPCRQENPNIVKAYATFKDQNFTVLGVSLDNNKSKWLAAIEKDKLEWFHVSDLKGWNNAVAGMFGVKSIPFSIIVDPNGVIIGKDLRGEELQQFLKENLAH